MKIDFSEGAKGDTEAENILRLAHRLPSTQSSQVLAEELVHQALAHLHDKGNPDRRIRELLAAQRGPVLAGLAAGWRRIRGPSNSEMELSRQRSEALERADRAERSSFEALAEMADVGRERDAANKKLESLLKRLDELEHINSK